MNNIALTPLNLAYMGLLDDFYDLYCEIKEVYEFHKRTYMREHYINAPLFCNEWDKLCLHDVKKKMEPYLNKYRYFLNVDCKEIHARAYAFSEFSFVKRSMTVIEDSTDPFIVSYKSFSEFLIEIQIILSILDHRFNYANNNKHSFGDSWTNITQRIHEQAAEEKDKCVNVSKDHTETSDNTLYIFDRLQNISCWKLNHPIISARYIAMVAKTSQLIALPVHYCNFCKKYFIGAKTLAVFEKEFGKLAILKKDISDMKISFGCFDPESKLHSLGYNVINGKLSEAERENLLIYLIDNKMISYVEICATIEQNISIFKNSYRHRLAVEKWITDLEAIGNYILKHPEKK